MQLLTKPQGHGLEKRTKSSRRVGQVGLENSLELQEGLVVETDVVELVRLQPCLLQAVADGVDRKAVVVLDAREALLLGGGHDLAIDDQSGSRVVVEGRDTEDGGHRESFSAARGRWSVLPGYPPSAGAIAASALYELSTYSDKEDIYLDAANKITESLTSENYRVLDGTNGGFILKHSVGNKPGGSEIDVAINYADYYNLEAIKRKENLKN